MSNAFPLVSVLMTSYNREKYIAVAIESVLNSTYKSFELIIVDDCSNDKTVNIATSYATRDERIRVYVNEKNLGDYPNRNQAASYAKGKYLKYVDADDLIYPTGLEVLVSMMEQFPDAGYGLCSLNPDKKQIFPFELSPGDAYRYHYFGPGLFHKAPLSAIFRIDAFKAVGGFTGKQHVGDFEMWHLLSRENRVVLMPQGIVWYREHADQQMAANRTNPLIPFKYFVLAKELITARCPLSEKEKKVVVKMINRTIVKMIMGRVKRLDFSKAKEMKNFKF
jgi:glycosyltransferase involved in cell wall biosynthesis